jgi:signal transduction histidine kinase
LNRPRIGLREKILSTHLLVAVSSLVALAAVLVLAPAIFAPGPSGSLEITPTLVLLAAAALAASVTALVLARWLYRQIITPVRRASALARLLAKGHYAESTHGLSGASGLVAEQSQRLSPSHSDELVELAAALDELALALQEAERRRTESFDEITHELRTPIAILEGYFEGLLDGHVKPTDETWAMLYDVASRAHRMIDTLRVLSRAEARREPTDLQSVAPEALARATLERMRLHFAEKGLALVADIPAGLPHVLADPDYTIQVLVNLLTNALRYTPVPGTVTLAVDLFPDAGGTGGTGGADDAQVADGADDAHAAHAAQGAREVVFRVTDTGMGIASEHIPHLFERFFRVDRSSSRAAGGSGIGLPVAKALVETMGGRIWAESPGPGKGSTFAFTLLLSADPPSS